MNTLRIEIVLFLANNGFLLLNFSYKFRTRDEKTKESERKSIILK